MTLCLIYFSYYAAVLRHTSLLKLMEVVAMIDEFFIPMKIESSNTFVWASWRKYNGYKKKWKKAMGFLVGRKAKQETKRTRIEIVSLRGRLLDRENLIAGSKPIPDILKELGWIVDDSEKWFFARYVQKLEKNKQERGTIIRVFSGLEKNKK